MGNHASPDLKWTVWLKKGPSETFFFYNAAMLVSYGHFFPYVSDIPTFAVVFVFIF
jgi:hypothetical protein